MTLLTWEHSWEPGNPVCQHRGSLPLNLSLLSQVSSSCPLSPSIPLPSSPPLPLSFFPLLFRLLFFYISFSLLSFMPHLSFLVFLFCSLTSLSSFPSFSSLYLSDLLFFLLPSLLSHIFSLSPSLQLTDTQRHTRALHTEKEAESNCVWCRRSFPL